MHAAGLDVVVVQYLLSFTRLRLFSDLGKGMNSYGLMGERERVRGDWGARCRC
jgi:hypothetical protein